MCGNIKIEHELVFVQSLTKSFSLKLIHVDNGNMKVSRFWEVQHKVSAIGSRAGTAGS